MRKPGEEEEKYTQERQKKTSSKKEKHRDPEIQTNQVMVVRAANRGPKGGNQD